MAPQDARHGPCAQVAQAHAPVDARGGDNGRLERVPGEAGDPGGVLDGGAGGKAGARIPDAQKGVEPCRGGERGLPAGAKAGGLDRGGVACFWFFGCEEEEEEGVERGAEEEDDESGASRRRR